MPVTPYGDNSRDKNDHFSCSEARRIALSPQKRDVTDHSRSTMAFDRCTGNTGDPRQPCVTAGFQMVSLGIRSDLNISLLVRNHRTTRTVLMTSRCPQKCAFPTFSSPSSSQRREKTPKPNFSQKYRFPHELLTHTHITHK